MHALIFRADVGLVGFKFQAPVVVTELRIRTPVVNGTERLDSQGAHRRHGHGEADEGTCTPTRSALISLNFAKLRKLPSQTCPPRDLRLPGWQ